VKQLLLFITILLLFGCGEIPIMNLNQKPLSGKWLEMFNAKPPELTAYAAQHPIKLENVLIKKLSISKSTIVGAEFKNTVWDDSFAQNTIISNTVFSGGRIFDTSFADSTLTNVTFDNVEMDMVEFVNASLINVTFKNCTIINSEIRNLKASTVRIENSELVKVTFFQSILKIDIIDSKIHEQGEFLGLKPGSSINIAGSFIGPYSDFTSAKLTSFTVKNSELKRTKLNSANVDKVVITDSKLDFAMAHSTFNTVHFSNVDNIVVGDSNVTSLTIENCKDNGDVTLSKSRFKTISIRDCPLLLLDARDAKGEKLTLTGMEIKNIDFSNFVVKDLIFTNVRMTENVNFINAQAQETQMTNVSISKGARVNMSGTNINFQ